MRDAYWIPTEEPPRREERPFLEAPSPYAYYPWEPTATEEVREDEDAPRVIIIEM